MKHLVVLFVLLWSSINYAQNITIDASYTAQNLVENVLFNNYGCATISNFSVSGNNSYAYFNGNNSSFTFTEGIVLSTGFTNNIAGPNTTLSDDNLGTPIDSDLNTFFSDTFDTTVLEFDFIPVTNYMSFEYIFASEEYQEGDNSTCIYSDVFAFLIKRVGDVNYTNIAVIPNTTIPVQVTTVHPEIPGSCPAENEDYFGSWNDNTAPINFNGQTAILKAESNVIQGETYHIKLVIADHSNYRYDSAVFLKAGSFNIGTNLGVDILRSSGNALCGNGSILLDTNIPTALSYTWTRDVAPYDGIYLPVLNGNNQTFNVTSEGKYKVAVDLGAGCISEGIIIVEYSSFPMVTDAELLQCTDNDGYTTAIFDFTEATNTITLNNTGLIVENYFPNFTLANTNTGGEITNYQAYTNSIQNEEIFARVANQDGCVSIAKITLQVFQNPKIKDDETFIYCLNTYPNVITLESGVLLDNPNNYNYNWFFDNGILPIEDLTLHTATIDRNEIGDYRVEITNSDGCMVSRTITLKASNIATITNVTVLETITSTRLNLIVDVTGEGDYQYAIDNYDFQDSNLLEGVLYGNHIITVKDKNGCLPNTQLEITILDYLKFFTPNGDNQYDTWNLNNPKNVLVNLNIVSNITIYNRFGKIMAVIDPNGSGWNGLYRNQLQPNADYWFSVDLINAKGNKITKTGHFSLKG